MRYGIKVSAVLIGTYLLLAHATQGGTLIGAGKSAVQGIVTTFQGR